MPRRDDGTDDDFLFNQGPTKGLGAIQFHDYHLAYDSFDLPNVSVFKEQIELFKELADEGAADQGAGARTSTSCSPPARCSRWWPTASSSSKTRESTTWTKPLMDQIFDFMVRDFSKFALQLYSKPSSTEAQMAQCLKMIRKPVVDDARYGTVWQRTCRR